jgi:hypothetical protein
MHIFYNTIIIYYGSVSYGKCKNISLMFLVYEFLEKLRVKDGKLDLGQTYNNNNNQVF